MSILKKLTAVGLASVLVCGVSFADTSDQTPAATNSNAAVAQSAKASEATSTAQKGNARTSREFISPLRKNRLERRVDRRKDIFSSDKQDASTKATTNKVSQSS
ncbi:hypothetical protein [Francisella sp. LA112445]|uniref:hypothetical protein n=1 Tax=Francisella sp. LA112445 TaxID=1395624 RepID=UPI001788D7F8|nr:hypothetical protein [Francisella sp. LA112445]QIW09624.1 hypothetical protein FIP56_02605 [Francisella sp. LA112445]